jgi:NAD+ synthase/NAD+ synthase (glutamine-hydrolysing)
MTMPSLKIAMAQINPVLGDLDANVAQIAAAAHEARRMGAEVIVTPELALSGYPPEDLLLRPDFLRACENALQHLAAQVDNKITLIVGHPTLRNGRCYNAATVLRPHREALSYFKQRLPNTQVFDEARYFTPGNTPLVVELNGVRAGLAICEDVWYPEPARQAKIAGAEILLALNASPCHLGKQSERAGILAQRVQETKIPALYVNLVGGQDELVFDGGSFSLNRKGEIAARLPQFASGLMVLEYREGDILPAGVSPALSEESEAWQALVSGVRDYVGKNHFPGVLIGLSGGIDSALTACIAVDALGAEKVRTVMMPSPYTAQMSLDDARAMARALGVRYDEISIGPAMQTFADMLAPQFAGMREDTTEENIQARIRGMILMALSNKTGALVLTTGNKSEMAVGYCTLYGDMAGGFAVIKDVYKTLVYRLAHYRNQLLPENPPIPQNVIDRPPSAELKPGQTDQDSLPPYDILDAIVRGYMEDNRSLEELVAAGLPKAAVKKTIRLLRLAEYKRRQSPVGIRITPRGFGKDWRYPITNHYTDED